VLKLGKRGGQDIDIEPEQIRDKTGGAIDDTRISAFEPVRPRQADQERSDAHERRLPAGIDVGGAANFEFSFERVLKLQLRFCIDRHLARLGLERQTRELALSKNPRAANVGIQRSQPHQVAREREVDNRVVSIPSLVESNGARLDAIQAHSRVALLEKNLIGRDGSD
jgi:hypothetical protein